MLTKVSLRLYNIQLDYRLFYNNLGLHITTTNIVIVVGNHVIWNVVVVVHDRR